MNETEAQGNGTMATEKKTEANTLLAVVKERKKVAGSARHNTEKKWTNKRYSAAVLGKQTGKEDLSRCNVDQPAEPACLASLLSRPAEKTCWVSLLSQPADPAC